MVRSADGREAVGVRWVFEMQMSISGSERNSSIWTSILLGARRSSASRIDESPVRVFDSRSWHPPTSIGLVD
jgi:hypothetical protein